MLVEKGADLSAKTAVGMTPLHLASRNGHEAVARMLVKNEAELSAKNQK